MVDRGCCSLSPLLSNRSGEPVVARVPSSFSWGFRRHGDVSLLETSTSPPLVYDDGRISDVSWCPGPKRYSLATCPPEKKTNRLFRLVALTFGPGGVTGSLNIAAPWLPSTIPTALSMALIDSMQCRNFSRLDSVACAWSRMVWLRLSRTVTSKRFSRSACSILNVIPSITCTALLLLSLSPSLSVGGIDSTGSRNNQNPACIWRYACNREIDNRPKRQDRSSVGSRLREHTAGAVVAKSDTVDYYLSTLVRIGTRLKQQLRGREILAANGFDECRVAQTRLNR